jgi:hypothetical protein
MRALENRRVASAAIMRSIAENHELDLFTDWSGEGSDAQLGWDCQELLVRCDRRDIEEQRDQTDRNSKTGGMQIEARLATSLESILRYQASIKRDLYRVLSALRDMQRERIEQS